MTPKEKAQEIYDKFNKIETPSEMNFEGKINLTSLSYIASKQCSLISVNEVLSVLFQHHKIDYWKEVKQEIENL